MKGKGLALEGRQAEQKDHSEHSRNKPQTWLGVVVAHRAMRVTLERGRKDCEDSSVRRRWPVLVRDEAHRTS